MGSLTLKDILIIAGMFLYTGIIIFTCERARQARLKKLRENPDMAEEMAEEMEKLKEEIKELKDRWKEIKENPLAKGIWYLSPIGWFYTIGKGIKNLPKGKYWWE